MRVQAHTHMHTYTCPKTHVHTCTRARTHVHTLAHTHRPHTHTHVHTPTHTHDSLAVQVSTGSAQGHQKGEPFGLWMRGGHVGPVFQVLRGLDE